MIWWRSCRNGLSPGQTFWMISIAGIVAVRVDGDQPAARPERPGERRDHALGLEVERGARAIGLRGDDQIVVGAVPPGRGMIGSSRNLWSSR